MIEGSKDRLNVSTVKNSGSAPQNNNNHSTALSQAGQTISTSTGTNKKPIDQLNNTPNTTIEQNAQTVKTQLNNQ